MIEAFVFITGAAFGSFFNVVIYRLPRGLSIVWPNSFCPACEKPIKPWDNIPLVSYLLLRGKCRTCGARIPVRYFIVEFLTAALSLVLLYKYSLSVNYLVHIFLVYLLLVISFIDIDHMLIPDIISLPGIPVGILFSCFFPEGAFGFSLDGLKGSLLGVLAGGGSIYLMGVFGSMVFRKEAMGGGDVKLMGMIGAFMGWKYALLAFFIAPFLGLVSGVYVLVKKKDTVIPYGPYLSLAAVISMLYGDKILRVLLPEI
ncbi:MAG: prepilin peptidase [Candidatus Omnitrophica bacterium]|nr:prepilin peptidase [Candidatus Omnitrophota bacterium]